MSPTTFDRHDTECGSFTEVLATLLAAMTTAAFLLAYLAQG